MKRVIGLNQLKTWEVSDICRECKGECCKHAPGESSPDDFLEEDGKFQWDKIRKLLESGDWCLDWWVGDPEGNRDDLDITRNFYFLRPNGKGQDDVFAPDVPGKAECKFLTENGCAAEIKPLACRTLKPAPNLGCDHELPPWISGSRQVSAILWKPYSDILYRIAVDILYKPIAG